MTSVALSSNMVSAPHLESMALRAPRCCVEGSKPKKGKTMDELAGSASNMNLDISRSVTSSSSTTTTTTNTYCAEENRAKKCEALDEPVFSPPRCIHKGMNLDVREISRLREECTKNLLKQKKLVLVLDLDNTLLHSTEVCDLSAEEQCLLELADATKEDDPGKSIYCWDGTLTKLRPFVRSFLREASEYYDMYIYTLGTREYALQIARFLDPEGVYFNSKILSREDCSRPWMKGLDVVLAEERTVVILDDKVSVWTRNIRNLIAIQEYRFFGPRKQLFDGHGNPLSAWEDAENELNSPLEIALNVLRCVHRKFFEFPGANDVTDVLDQVFAEYGSV